MVKFGPTLSSLPGTGTADGMLSPSQPPPPDHVHKYQLSGTDMSKENNGHRSDPPTASATALSEEYRVGPGRPPKEYQFKPGQSGNPKGAKRKPPSIAPDLKLLLERALSNNASMIRG